MVTVHNFSYKHRSSLLNLYWVQVQVKLNPRLALSSPPHMFHSHHHHHVLYRLRYPALFIFMSLLVTPNIPLTTTRLRGWSRLLQPHLCCSVCVIMWSHKRLDGGYITNLPMLCSPDTVVVTTRQQCRSAGGADRPESVTFPSLVKDPQSSYPKIRQNSCSRHVPPTFIFLITQDQ